jgi:hypothetical protein
MLAIHWDTNNHQTQQIERFTKMDNVEQSNQASSQAQGKQAAEGFNRTRNTPMATIPPQVIRGNVPTFDTATIAPTTGPVPPAEQ